MMMSGNLNHRMVNFVAVVGVNNKRRRPSSARPTYCSYLLGPSLTLGDHLATVRIPHAPYISREHPEAAGRIPPI
jgi:hypothetical protein